MSTFRKLRAISLRIVCVPLFFSMVANYANAITVDSVGDEFIIEFNGLVEGIEQPGLTAEAIVTLTSITSNTLGGQDWSFDVTLTNTSSAPITASRISIFGFDVAGGLPNDSVAVSGFFDRPAAGNLPGVGKIDQCFKVGGGYSNCAGGGGGGLELGESGDFTFVMLNFGPTEIDFTDFYVRYQSIDGTPYGDGWSGVGIGTEVPVPAAAWLFGSALLGLGGIARTRRS